MDLRRIGGVPGRIERVAGKGPGRPAGAPSASSGSDRLELSKEAAEVLSGYEAVRSLAAAPAESRPERVGEVRVRIAEGYYDQPAVRRATALRLAQAFLGLAPRLA